jgi:hypothetical protein
MAQSGRPLECSGRAVPCGEDRLLDMPRYDPRWDQVFREIADGLSKVEVRFTALDAADQLRVALDSDPQWVELRRTLNQLSVREWAKPRPTIPDVFSRDPQTGLAQAQADLSERLPEIQQRLAEVEEAVKQLTADPEKSKVVERLSGAIKRTDASQLSSYALLVILWWLLMIWFPSEATNGIPLIALWYTIERDRKKGD